MGAAPQIAIRVDASLEIGTGHVMRCVTLADGLAGRGANCVFLCRPHEGHLIELIEERGHEVKVLSEPFSEPLSEPQMSDATEGDPAHAPWLGASWQKDAEQCLAALKGEHYDWLVVDHYGLDARWQKALRSFAKHILVMDDLADRRLDCDLLLDPTLGRERADYDALIPPNAKACLGPRYALLRPEFAAARSASLARRKTPQLHQILVNMGGVDKDNASEAVLDALDQCGLPEGCRIVTVMGSRAPWADKVAARAKRMSVPAQIIVGASNMAELMRDSDLAIGAGGGTSWERCCLGLPTLMLSVARNQDDIAATLAQAGAVAVSHSPAQIGELLAELLERRGWSEFLQRTSAKAAAITSGEGTELVAQEILGEMLP